jgi:hypothetical protein
MAFSRPWIPFREMGELRRNIDDMLEHLKLNFELSSTPYLSSSALWSPPSSNCTPIRQ